MKSQVLSLPGDGIGVEVTAAAVRVLRHIGEELTGGIYYGTPRGIMGEGSNERAPSFCLRTNEFLIPAV